MLCTAKCAAGHPPTCTASPVFSSAVRACSLAADSSCCTRSNSGASAALNSCRQTPRQGKRWQKKNGTCSVAGYQQQQHATATTAALLAFGQPARPACSAAATSRTCGDMYADRGSSRGPSFFGSGCCPFWAGSCGSACPAAPPAWGPAVGSHATDGCSAPGVAVPSSASMPPRRRSTSSACWSSPLQQRIASTAGQSAALVKPFVGRFPTQHACNTPAGPGRLRAACVHVPGSAVFSPAQALRLLLQSLLDGLLHSGAVGGSLQVLRGGGLWGEEGRWQASLCRSV